MRGARATIAVASQPVSGLIRFVRVRDWAHFLALPLATASLPLDPTRLLAGVTLAAGCLAYAYAWNEWVDERLWEPGAAARRGIGASPAVLRGVIVGLFVVTLLAAVPLGAAPVFAVALSLSGGALYSGGPRLKRLPVVGTLTNAWIFAPLGLLGARELPPTAGSALLLLAFSALLLQNQVIHEAAHRKDDEREAICTTVLRYGVPFARALSVGIGVLAVAVVVALGASVGTPLLAALASAPVLLVTAASARPGALEVPARASAIRLWHRAASLLTGGAAWALIASSAL